MKNKIIRGALLLLPVLFAIFALIKVYEYYSQPDEEVQEIRHVMLYTKAACRYCEMSKSLLERIGLLYDHADISNKPNVQQKLINNTGQHTVPYIFIQGEFIGGYSDLAKMQNDGRLLEIAIQIRNADDD